MLKSIRQILCLFDGTTRRQGVALTVLLMLNGIAEMMSVGAIVPFLSVATRDISEQHALIRTVYDFFDFSNQQSFVIFIAVLVGATFFARTVFMMFVQYFLFSFIGNARTRISNIFMRGYISLPYANHLRTSSLVMSRRLTQAIPDIFVSSVVPVVLLAGELVMVSALVVLLLLVDVQVTLATMLIFGIIVGLIQRVTGGRLRKWGQEGIRTTQLLLAISSHVLGAIKEIKVMSRSEPFARHFGETVARNALMRLKYNTTSQYPKMILEMLGLWGLLAVVAVTIGSGRSLVEILPVLGLFGIAAMRLLPSLSRISMQMSNLRYSEAQVGELLADLESFKSLPPASAGAPPMPFENKIEIDRLSFAYAEAGGTALNDVSLEIKQGEWVAIVGPSGSGKTTLFNLLLGLMPPSNGNIRVDGRPIAGDIGGWQARIGYVPQDVFILDDTLRANIVFGSEPGPDEERKLHDAVALAQLTDLVARLPDGLDSPVGERGANISGGERQRIGIARALFHGADVLMLDEATSALDAATEAAVSGAIASLKGRRTIIAIAHRLSAVRGCDKIFLLENGRLAASGTFNSLAAENSTFAGLVNRMGLSVSESNAAD